MIEIKLESDFKSKLLDKFASELAERCAMFESPAYLRESAAGDFANRFIDADVVVDGVPLALTVRVCSGVTSSDRNEGHFDLCLYHRELDLSFADHEERFATEPAAGRPDVDPYPWFERALSNACEQLADSPEFVYLHEAAQLRLAIVVPPNAPRAAPRL